MKARKWCRLGCLYLFLEFDLSPLTDLNFKERKVKVKIVDWGGTPQCPLDKSTCKLSVDERLKCLKLKRLLRPIN